MAVTWPSLALSFFGRCCLSSGAAALSCRASQPWSSWCRWLERRRERGKQGIHSLMSRGTCITSKQTLLRPLTRWCPYSSSFHANTTLDNQERVLKGLHDGGPVDPRTILSSLKMTKLEVLPHSLSRMSRLSCPSTTGLSWSTYGCPGCHVLVQPDCPGVLTDVQAVMS